MKRSVWIWLAAAIPYAAFCWWYTNTAGPLSASEIEQFVQAMRSDDAAPERIENLRRFMEEDDGSQFLMVNVLDLAADPAPIPGVPADEPTAAVMARYMEHMYPELFKRASHPVFAGDAVFRAMDMAGVESLDTADRWTQAALVRYRSRRDLLEIGLAPVFADKHIFKIAALEKTIAYPVEPTLYLSDLRLLLFLLLTAIVAIVDRLASARRR